MHAIGLGVFAYLYDSGLRWSFISHPVTGLRQDNHDQSVNFLSFSWLEVGMSLPSLSYVTVKHLLGHFVSKRSESTLSTSNIAVSDASVFIYTS